MKYSGVTDMEGLTPPTSPEAMLPTPSIRPIALASKVALGVAAGALCVLLPLGCGTGEGDRAMFGDGPRDLPPSQVDEPGVQGVQDVELADAGADQPEPRPPRDPMPPAPPVEVPSGPLAPMAPLVEGPRLQMARSRFLSSERIEVDYVDVARDGNPFLGIYDLDAALPREAHDVKFDKDKQVSTDSRTFKEQPAGTYFVRLVYEDGFVADQHIIYVVSDADKDGIEDTLDGCPDDGKKTEPGVCGCGEKDKDDDDDGAFNCLDECPKDAAKTVAGMCGCGFIESLLDQDGDGLEDCYDECPTDPLKTDKLQCGCFEPDVDLDGDGSADCKDKCPDDPDKTKPGKCGCGVPDTDTDGDKVPDCKDQCPLDAPDPAGECGCGLPESVFCRA